jgi:hypothetical protein
LNSETVAMKRGHPTYLQFVKSSLSMVLSLHPLRVYDVVRLVSMACPTDGTYIVSEL